MDALAKLLQSLASFAWPAVILIVGLNGNDGFAVRLSAYGPTLCVARVRFHDGTEATLTRYLDFEGTGYKYKEIPEE